MDLTWHISSKLVRRHGPNTIQDGRAGAQGRAAQGGATAIRALGEASCQAAPAALLLAPALGSPNPQARSGLAGASGAGNGEFRALGQASHMTCQAAPAAGVLAPALASPSPPAMRRLRGRTRRIPRGSPPGMVALHDVIALNGEFRRQLAW